MTKTDQIAHLKTIYALIKLLPHETRVVLDNKAVEVGKWTVGQGHRFATVVDQARIELEK
jgi:hypothetical protein